jgi:hypothetical protein
VADAINDRLPESMRALVSDADKRALREMLGEMLGFPRYVFHS